MKKQLNRFVSFASLVVISTLAQMPMVTSANAALIMYTDRDEWQAALSGGDIITDTIDYTATTSSSELISLTNVGVTFSVNEGVRNQIGDLFFTGSQLGMRVDPDDNNDPQEITGTFANSGVNAFAFTFGAINNQASLTRAHLGLLGQDYNLFDLGGNGTGAQSGFVGIISDTNLLTSFSFNNGPFTRGQEDFFIDNVEIGSIESIHVPEPAAIILFSLGLIGIRFSKNNTKK